jgi:hypothetical protein
MTEKEWQQRITDTCDVLRLRWHHETDSRRSKKGFPDLVIVGTNGVIFVELKSQRGRIKAEQQEWVDDINTAGGEAHIWRPLDWPIAEARLRQLAGRF